MRVKLTLPKHTKGGDWQQQFSSFSSLLEMAFSTFGRRLPQIALLVGNKIARLRVQGMSGVCRMPAFSATLVAFVLATGRNIAVTEVEDCIFIHSVLPFIKYRNVGIGIVQE